MPRTRIIVIRIAARWLADYARSRQPELVARLRKRLSEQMAFDAFVSYSIENFDLAERWRAALLAAGLAAGLAVYMSAASTMTRFEPEIDLALGESLVMLPIISGASLRSEWVPREIAKRKAIFDNRHANILPVAPRAQLAAWSCRSSHRPRVAASPRGLAGLSPASLRPRLLDYGPVPRTADLERGSNPATRRSAGHTSDRTPAA